MHTLYCISGLGADERIFANFTLENYKIEYIHWIPPRECESMAKYARRLLNSITITVPFSLLGVSFGGILAIELAQIIDPERVIIVSSYKNHQELPWYYRIGKKLRLQKLIPARLIRYAGCLNSYLNGADHAEERRLLDDMLASADLPLFFWSLDRILNWENREPLPPNLIHIHGTADRLLPIRYVDADIAIEGGSHLMIYNRADEVAAIVNRILSPDYLLSRDTRRPKTD